MIMVFKIVESSEYNSLRDYLLATNVDAIKDDNEFCEEEFNQISDWYSNHKHFSEDDELCLQSRGYETDYFDINLITN